MKKYGKSLKKMKILLIIAGLTLLLITIAIPPNYSTAREYPRVKPEWVMPEGYPDWFNGFGRIGYIDNDVVVINDFEYRLSPYVDYHTPTSPKYAYKDYFVSGVMVGFLFDSEGMIRSIWMITMEDKGRIKRGK